jgi:hypothetical protein
MEHMTTILTNVADIYLDLYAIAHDLQRPLTPEQLHTASQAHHDMMARLEIKGLIGEERSRLDNGLDDLLRMKALVTKFVDTYFWEPEAGISVPLSVKAADDCVAYFNDLLFEDYWPEPEDIVTSNRTSDSQNEGGGWASHNDREPTLKQVARQFVDVYRRKHNIDYTLDEDQTETLSHLFLELIDEYQDEQRQ